MSRCAPKDSADFNECFIVSGHCMGVKGPLKGPLTEGSRIMHCCCVVLIVLCIGAALCSPYCVVVLPASFVLLRALCCAASSVL